MTDKNKKFEGTSEYLNSIEKRYPEVLDMDLASLESLNAQIHDVGAIDDSDLEQAKRSLRRLKAIFDYRWSLLRLKNTAHAVELGKIRAEFSGQTINKALAIAWRSPQTSRFLSRSHQQDSGTNGVPGLFVLGLGKLGGYDLNFSSDVDLIAFYDPKVLPVPETRGRTDICTRVLKLMTNILIEPLDGEFVWRVDWRLRPDASVAPIVMSTDAAEDFYFFRSLPWHRLALIKARAVAGDIDTAKAFLKRLEPYIWRQNLDYSIVDEIRYLKEKINQEHPQLRLAREQEKREGQIPSDTSCEGFNLKLGKGGIREIEFLCNTLQLLWGGKKPTLRASQTVEVIRALETQGLIENQTADSLRKHYVYLRWVEDGIQLRENLQTHTWPKSPQAQGEIQKLLGYASLEELVQTLTDTKAEIGNEYARFFESFGDQNSDLTTPSSDASVFTWIDELSGMAKSILDDWEDGFLRYALPAKSLSTTRSFLSILLRIIDQSPGEPSNHILALDQFFKTIPSVGQYIRLLAEHPAKLNDIVGPLLNVPPMNELLTQSPHIVEYLFDAEPETTSKAEFDSDFVLVSADFEIRLQRFRRFVNEQLYKLMLGLLNGLFTTSELQKQLTLLAEYCLNLGLEIVKEDLSLSESPIAIMGMGKLGMGAMAPLSDLDLIFVAEEGVDLELATRFSNRFRHLLDVRTSEGRAYEMDMRLRPSGRSGPATVSLSSYANYQQNKAKTWEHIALVASRPITGSSLAVKKLKDIRARVLAGSRDRTQFLMDAKKMHSRVKNQRIARPGDERLNVKLRPGGLFETDYLCACLVILAQIPTGYSSETYDEMVRAVVSKTQNTQLMDSVGFWRALLVWSRMFGLEDMNMATLTEDQINMICRDLGCDTYDDLLSRIQHHGDAVSNGLTVLFSDLDVPETDDLSDWDELSVRWAV